MFPLVLQIKKTMLREVTDRLLLEDKLMMQFCLAIAGNKSISKKAARHLAVFFSILNLSHWC